MQLSRKGADRVGWSWAVLILYEFLHWTAVTSNKTLGDSLSSPSCKIGKRSCRFVVNTLGLAPPLVDKIHKFRRKQLRNIKNMGAKANNNIDKTKEIWEYDEKIKKRELVVNTIIQRSASSSHQILQDINEAATSATGSSVIEAIVLSGGYTNYSYKIFIPDQPHLCLFAKLTFERAVWNPDKDALYDLQRTVNEYEMMSTFSKIKPDCVIAPLALWDVEHEGQKMKLLVTHWS